MTQNPAFEKLEQKIESLEKEFAECKQALITSRENEERLKLILQSTNDGIWDWDAKEDKAYSSTRYRELIGFTEEDDNYPVAWDEWASLIHPDDYDYVIRDFWKYLKEKRSYDLEYRYRHTNGQYRWHSSKGIAIFDKEGNIQRIVGSTWDINDRKLAEEEIKNSEEKYRSLVQLVGDRVWETDQDGIFTFADPKTKSFLGYEPQEIIGNPFTHLMIEEEAERVTGYFRNRIEPFEEFENTQIHKDGRKVVIEASGLPIFDSHGNSIGWRGIDSDVTKQRQAEEELRQSEEKFRSIVEVTSDWIWEIDQNGIFTFGSPNIRDVLGYELDEVIGKSIQFFMPEEYAEKTNEFFFEKMKQQAPFKRFEHLSIHKNGQSLVIETSGLPIFNADRVIVGWRGVDSDVTERVHMEQKLRESEEKFRSLVETSSDWIFEIDPKGIFTYADPKVKGFLGYEREEIIGMPITDLMTEEEADIVSSYFLEMDGMNEHLQALKITVMHKDGTPVPVETNALPIIDELGDFVGWRGMHRDITERVKAEEELRKYREHLEELVKQRTAQLEAANKELESFAYSVSHDLRAPLRAIDGFSLALLEDYEEKLDDEGKDFLNRVRSSSQRMGQLIDDILKLSRLTRSDMCYENVDLSAISRTISQELQAGDPDRDVEVTITPDLIERGDHPLLQVALENLISNAWKFTAGQGHAQIKFGTEVIGEETAYFVSDNGAGFDMAYANKLFGAFQRLHSAKDFPGSGIGLATAQRAIHRHGGRIWAKGAVNEGATFYFKL